jgi:hypothetical protein
MSILSDSEANEMVARLRAGAPFRVECDHVRWYANGEISWRVAANVYLYDGDRWGRKGLQLLADVDDPDQEDSFPSLLRSLARVIEHQEVTA